MPALIENWNTVFDPRSTDVELVSVTSVSDGTDAEPLQHAGEILGRSTCSR